MSGSTGPISGTPVFNDGKAPDALRTIGEVTRALGIRQHVLRYWEEQFPALEPIKRSGGRRYYRPEDVALIVEIDRLVHREGYTLRGACKALEARDTTEVPSPVSAAPQAESDIERVLVELAAVRSQLATALAQA